MTDISYNPVSPVATVFWPHLVEPDELDGSYGVTLLFNSQSIEWKEAWKNIYCAIEIQREKLFKEGIDSKPISEIKPNFFPIRKLKKEKEILGNDIAVKFKSHYKLTNIFDSKNQPISSDSIRNGYKIMVGYDVSYYNKKENGAIGYAFRPNSIILIEAIASIEKRSESVFSDENLKAQQEILKNFNKKLPQIGSFENDCPF